MKMMKTAALIFFTCLIISLSANFQLGTAQTGLPEPVLDTAGRPLHPGTNYYILPATSGNGGGLTLEIDRSRNCPYEIVQSWINGDSGLPLTFLPVNNDTVIRVNTDHNVKFANFSSTVCPESNVWRLDAGGESPDPVFVIVGGAEGNPGRDTLSNWFKIQKYEDAYEIEFCPSVPCEPCRVLCGNIGIYIGGGRRRLAINQPHFKIVFRRV